MQNSIAKWRVRKTDSRGKNPLTLSWYKIKKNATQRCINQALTIGYVGNVTVEERAYQGGPWTVIRTIEASNAWRDKVDQITGQLNQLFGG